MTTVLRGAATEAPFAAQVADAVPNAKALAAAGSETPGGARSGPAAVLDEAGWRCPMCGAMAGPQDLDDDPDLPCWDCQQGFREAWIEYVRESA